MSWRVFLDANVLFSASYQPNSGLLELWKLKGIGLCSSSYAVEEAKRNLKTSEAKKRLSKLSASLEIVETFSSNLDLPRAFGDLNKKDRPIVLAALRTKADYLVTGDKRDFGKYFGKKVGSLKICSPRTFLKEFKKS